MSTNIPEDSVVSTLYFAPDVSFSDPETLAVAVWDAFLEVETLYPSTVAQNDHVIKIYDMADPEPRVPIWEETYDFINPPSGNPLPAEVALVMSYRAAYVSGVPQARRRGRIYFGPLDTACLHTDGRPTVTCIDKLQNFGNALLAASTASTQWDWVVHSKVAGSSHNVVGGWVDNAFDTQRRRGVAVTTRELWT